jgi:nucleoid-associated protein YgaU
MRDYKNSSFLLGIILVLAGFTATGCVVRTYSVQKQRADLDLNSGNRGFLAGKTEAPAVVAKPTRETKVVEIEVFPLIKSLKKDKNAPAAKQPQLSEPSAQAVQAQAVTSMTVAQEYKVQENDTLQKIAQKFYGTMHKWNKIYEANKDKLKGPDKIKPGQVLKIPADTRPQALPAPKAAEPKEPFEKLK